MNEVRTTKDEGGIVIGQDILDMMADAGNRHESLKSGHLRVIVRIEGGDVPKGEAGAWFTLEHYGVYADGQNFARYAKGLKSTDDIAAALREGFVDPREYKWKRASRAKKAADWVANFLPYAAMLAIGIMASRCLFGEKTPDNLPESDPERAAQHLASEAVEVPHEPSTNAALPPVERGVSGGSDPAQTKTDSSSPKASGFHLTIIPRFSSSLATTASAPLNSTVPPAARTVSRSL